MHAICIFFFRSFEYNAGAELVKEVQFEEVEGLALLCSRILWLLNNFPSYFYDLLYWIT